MKNSELSSGRNIDYRLLLESLITKLLQAEEFAIGLTKDEIDITNSVITADQYSDDQCMELLCDPGGNCIFVLSCWDDAGERQTLNFPLVVEDYDCIPTGLLMLMTSAASENRTRTYNFKHI
ncbi:hypothetical protein [Mucilaginibacter sp. SP1R1]|uniref:hypothetical protein n=1 Tax=Mucilaginibacter sp. SP1R1 TaxID=2723091 RepID=UPI00160DDA84|nr:hypothetical protein [Mucilaginibacter sp. SP1R1]MBB6150009.1 hypothetical protein [Mucilaginibacter sp. SP1R1]